MKGTHGRNWECTAAGVQWWMKVLGAGSYHVIRCWQVCWPYHMCTPYRSLHYSHYTEYCWQNSNLCVFCFFIVLLQWMMKGIISSKLYLAAVIPSLLHIYTWLWNTFQWWTMHLVVYSSFIYNLSCFTAISLAVKSLNTVRPVRHDEGVCWTGDLRQHSTGPRAPPVTWPGAPIQPLSSWSNAGEAYTLQATVQLIPYNIHSAGHQYWCPAFAAAPGLQTSAAPFLQQLLPVFWDV